MTMIRYTAIFLGAALASGCENDALTYDDCILKYVKSGMDNVAVRLLQRSCRSKFPDKQVSKNTRTLTNEELNLLKGRAALSHSDYFAGSMYNGNRTLTITEIELAVSPATGENPVIRNYKKSVTIRPLTTENFGFSIALDGFVKSYSWKLEAARGFEMK